MNPFTLTQTSHKNPICRKLRFKIEFLVFLLKKLIFKN